MKKLLLSIVLILILGIAWYLLSPLFFDTTVDEALPSGLTEDEERMMEKMESMTPEEVEAMPEEERMEMKDMMNDLSEKMPDTVVEEPMEAQPTVEISGSFKDADDFHRGSGTASVYALPDGNRILRFEDFEVTNGPALRVYLVRDPSGDVNSGYVDLGELKGNKGNQNYDIDPNLDLSMYGSVIIWCEPFSVTFATAELR